MRMRLSRYEKQLYLLVDLLMLNCSFLIGFQIQFGSFELLYDLKYHILFLFINFSWLLIVRISNYNITDRRLRTDQLLLYFAKVLFFNLMLCLAFITIIKGHQYSRLFILKYYTLFLIIGGAGRLLFAYYLRLYRSSGKNFKRVVVVGVNSFSIDFVNEIIQHPEYGYKFLGFFDYRNDASGGEFKVEEFDKIYSFLLDYNIDEVYISLPSDTDYRTKEFIKFCHLNYIKVNFLNEFIHLLNRKTIHVQLDYNGPTPIVSVIKEPLEIALNKILKRAFDLGFALLVFITIFPWLFPLVALAIKLTSKGPVFFKQMRTGMNNEAFLCYKFRTMTVNSDSDSKQAVVNDPRITAIGALLRKTNIDELPQFINVIKGDMSVVGPRPHMLQHTRMYQKLIAPFTVRHWVKPGITGLAQAKGYRGETKEVRQMYQRVKMDVFYIQNWSLLLDVKIVFMTFWNMVTFQKTGA